MKLYKKLIALISAAAISVGFQTSVMAAELENLALNKSVTASGFTYGMAPQAVVDGDEITGWSSETANNTWLIIDLGEKMNISEIQLVTRMNLDQPHTRNYIYLECSNSAEFIKYERVADIGAEGIPFKSLYTAKVDGKYRYVRYRKYLGDYSYISEIRVMGTTGNGPAANTDDGNHEQFLNVLGIETDELSENVTRGEAAKAFAQLIKATGGTESFKDIRDEETLKAARALCNIGIISPSENGKFNPDDNIGYFEALKIAVCALGCRVKAEHSGGYPAGYISTAADLKITRGINTGNFNKAEFIKLMYNMLEADVYEPSSFSDKSISYEKAPEPFLEKYYDIKKAEGILDETYIMSLYIEKTITSKSNYLIDGNKYYSHDDYIGLFAKGVVCYYKSDNDDLREIVYMYPKEEQGVRSEKLIDVKSVSSSQISIEDDDKTVKLSLDSKCKILRNGKLTTVKNLGTLSKYGVMELYDNNGDDSYDVVRISETVTHMVDSVKQVGNDVAFYFTDKTHYTVNSEIDSFVKYNNGSTGSLEDVKKDDVISICEQNSNIFEAYIGNYTVEGKITAFGDYDVTMNWKDVYDTSNGVENPGAKKVGNYGTMYFDYFGDAFFFDDNVDNGEHYGLWTKIKRSDTLTDNAQMKIFTQTGKFAVYTVSAPIVIDGKKYTNTNEAVSKLEDIFYRRIGASIGVVIKYTSNSYLKLTKIDTEEKDAGSDDDTLVKFTNAEDLNPNADYWYCMGVWNQKYVINDDAVIFIVPDDVEKEDDFSISTKADWGEINRFRLSGYGKERKDMCVFDAVVQPKLRQGYSDEPRTVIVDKVNTIYDAEEEETVYTLSGYSSGYNTFKVSEEFNDIVKTLSRGCILQIAVSADNTIENLMLVLDSKGSSGNISFITKPFSGDSVYNEPLYAAVGVYAQEDNIIRMCGISSCNVYGPSETELSPSIDASKALIYIYDSEKDKLLSGGVSDIISYIEDKDNYSRIYARVFRGRPREIVIYR